MVTCPECGGEVPESARVCGYCGHRLHERPASAAPDRPDAVATPGTPGWVWGVLVVLVLGVAGLVTFLAVSSSDDAVAATTTAPAATTTSSAAPATTTLSAQSATTGASTTTTAASTTTTADLSGIPEGVIERIGRPDELVVIEHHPSPQAADFVFFEGDPGTADGNLSISELSIARYDRALSSERAVVLAIEHGAGSTFEVYLHSGTWQEDDYRRWGMYGFADPGAYELNLWLGQAGPLQDWAEEAWWPDEELWVVLLLSEELDARYLLVARQGDVIEYTDDQALPGFYDSGDWFLEIQVFGGSEPVVVGELWVIAPDWAP